MSGAADNNGDVLVICVGGGQPYGGASFAAAAATYGLGGSGNVGASVVINMPAADSAPTSPPACGNVFANVMLACAAAVGPAVIATVPALLTGVAATPVFLSFLAARGVTAGVTVLFAIYDKCKSHCDSDKSITFLEALTKVIKDDAFIRTLLNANCNEVWTYAAQANTGPSLHNNSELPFWTGVAGQTIVSSISMVCDTLISIVARVANNEDLEIQKYIEALCTAAAMIATFDYGVALECGLSGRDCKRYNGTNSARSAAFAGLFEGPTQFLVPQIMRASLRLMALIKDLYNEPCNDIENLKERVKKYFLSQPTDADPDAQVTFSAATLDFIVGLVISGTFGMIPGASWQAVYAAVNAPQINLSGFNIAPAAVGGVVQGLSMMFIRWQKLLEEMLKGWVATSCNRACSKDGNDDGTAYIAIN